MDDDQDWRLRVDVADAPALHARLRGGGAHHLESELEPLLGDDVVLSVDDGTLFAYAGTRAEIDRARAAVEARLAQEGLPATIRLSHWNDAIDYWHQVEPPADEDERAREQAAAAEARAETERDATVVTRTVAVTSGRLARRWVEETLTADARSRGIRVAIVEHPHILQTQIVFTLTGPRSDVEDVIADLRDRTDQLTLLEGAYLAPI